MRLKPKDRFGMEEARFVKRDALRPTIYFCVAFNTRYARNRIRSALAYSTDSDLTKVSKHRGLRIEAAD